MTGGANSGDELLEPFRPRSGLRSNVQVRVTNFSRSCSRTGRSLACIVRSMNEKNGVSSATPTIAEIGESRDQDVSFSGRSGNGHKT